MPERIDARPALTMIGGALLLVGLFLTWYVIPVPPPAEATEAGNAWAVFESLDLVMAAIGIAAIYVSYEQMTAEPRVGAGWLLPLGLLALVVVVSQLLDAPPVFGGTQVDPGTGAWLGLGGAAAMVVGGVLSAAHVSLALELDSSSSSGGGTTTRRRAAQSDV